MKEPDAKSKLAIFCTFGIHPTSEEKGKEQIAPVATECNKILYLRNASVSEYYVVKFTLLEDKPNHLNHIH